jgi:hypothetical protein
MGHDPDLASVDGRALMGGGEIRQRQRRDRASSAWQTTAKPPFLFLF